MVDNPQVELGKTTQVELGKTTQVKLGKTTQVELDQRLHAVAPPARQCTVARLNARTLDRTIICQSNAKSVKTLRERTMRPSSGITHDLVDIDEKRLN